MIPYITRRCHPLPGRMDAWQRLGGGFWFISLFVLEIKAIHINFEVTTHDMFCRVVRSKGLMLPSQRDTGK